MTDVANCMNASTPTKAHMGGQIIPDSPESAILSPEVKEAMDRIFPQSASQFLHEALSFGEYSLNSNASVEVSKVTAHARNPASNITSLSSITTQANIDASISGSASMSGSSVERSSPVTSTNSHSVIPVPTMNDPNKEVVVRESKSLALPAKPLFKNRISKADFEIVTSCDALINAYDRTSRRQNCIDMSSSECHSRGESDSEDMSRPFASITREKKRRKKRKRKAECDKEKANSCLSEHNANSGDEFKTSSKSWKTHDGPAAVKTAENCRLESQKDCVSKCNNAKQNSHHESLSSCVLIKKSSLGFSHNSQDILDSSSFYKDYGMTSEDISNISYSSAKENVQGELRRSHQKLPKTKRQYFHIVKHINKIRKTFPPCYVVAKKISTPPCHNVTTNYCKADNILPLPVRVQNLSDLCDKGYLACRRKELSSEPVYKKMCAETFIYNKFEAPRARNLRKRDKNISYVEPSEDDILDEFSKKCSRLKSKDCSYSKSEDESSKESKKKKTHDSSYTSADTPVSLEESSDKIIISDKKNVADKKLNVEQSRWISAPEVIVYPRTSIINTMPYQSHIDRRDMFAPEINEQSKHMLYPQDIAKNSIMVPNPSCISVLSSTTKPGCIPPYPVSLFSSTASPGFPGGLPAHPFVERAPSSCVVSTASGAPNYCVVKMNGKDVLLRLVPSSNIGTPLPVVMPKGKSFLPPGPAHMLNQPLRQMHPVTHSTHTIHRPVTSVVTTPQVNVLSAPLQPLYGIPFANRPAYSSANNITLPAIPVIPSPHLASYTGIQPLPLTSPGASYRQVTALPASATKPASSTFGTAAPARPISSYSLATQSLSSPMTAPNMTSLLRNVVVPGPRMQSLLPIMAPSDNSVGIILPGTSTTVTPGHFATAGEVSSNSPLARISVSSELLPQHKSTSAVPELSSEQHAAKRRRLEKKYPLPPGVVIKTEPLNTFPQPVSVTASRSLLTQNVQLLTASRTGSGVQRFRLIGPSLTNGISVSNVRGGSNIIYRAASLGRGQTILVPTSLGLIATTKEITSPSFTVSSPITSSLRTSPVAVSAATVTTKCAASTTNVVTDYTDSLSLNTTTLSHSYRNASNVSSLPLYQSRATGFNSANASTAGSPVRLVSPSEVSHESTVAMNGTHTSHSPVNILDQSITCSRATAVPNNDLSMYPSKALPGAALLDNAKTTVEKLRKFIQIQESCGLKGERLDKLKDLLHTKEQYYNELQKQAEVSTPSNAAPEFPESDIIDCEGRGHQEGGSVTNPFVID